MSNSVDPDETAHMSRLIWIYAVSKSLLLSSVAVKELMVVVVCFVLFFLALKFILILVTPIQVCKFKNRRVHVRSSGVKGFWMLIKCRPLLRYIEDIQTFGMNMTFISSREVKTSIYHECRRHE